MGVPCFLTAPRGADLSRSVHWLAVREVGLGVAFGALIALVTRTPALASLFGARPIDWVGYRAYSFFLLHQPLIWFFSEFLTKVTRIPEGTTKLALLWTVGLAITFLAGEIFFRLVERPCIRWAKRVPHPVVPDGPVLRQDREASGPAPRHGV